MIIGPNTELPILANKFTLVTECIPPEGIMEYDVFLVNQVFGICGQLRDGDLTPFLRSRIDCETIGEIKRKHIVYLDTNLVHDELVAVAVTVRYDPFVQVEKCTLKLVSPEIKETLTEFQTTDNERCAAIKSGNAVVLGMAYLSGGIQQPTWNFQAKDAQFGPYEQYKVGLMAGKAVQGNHSNTDLSSLAAPPAGITPRQDVNMEEGARNILKNGSTEKMVSPWYLKMPEVPDIANRQSRLSTEASPSLLKKNIFADYEYEESHRIRPVMPTGYGSPKQPILRRLSGSSYDIPPAISLNNDQRRISPVEPLKNVTQIRAVRESTDLADIVRYNVGDDDVNKFDQSRQSEAQGRRPTAVTHTKRLSQELKPVSRRTLAMREDEDLDAFNFD